MGTLPLAFKRVAENSPKGENKDTTGEGENSGMRIFPCSLLFQDLRKLTKTNKQTKNPNQTPNPSIFQIFTWNERNYHNMSEIILCN